MSLLRNEKKILINLFSVLPFVGGTTEMSKESRAPGVMDIVEGYFASVLKKCLCCKRGLLFMWR